MQNQASASHKVFVALVATALALPPSAQATNGHFLHGVGAVNSSMGGAGVAAPLDLLGSFYHNPAGLATFTSSRADFAFEMFRAERTVSSSAGPMSGSTTSGSGFVPIPAFALSMQLPNRQITVGIGGMGIGGFGVNYPADPNNPVLAPRPYGFGNVYSNFQLLKIAPAIAANVTERLSVGFALNLDWAALQVDPFPVAAPAADPGPDGTPGTQDDRAFYSSATAGDGSFGAGFQAGLIFRASPMMAFGVAYTSVQKFSAFEYNAVYENPNLATFGAPRELSFKMDVPAVIAGGISLTPSDRLLLTADARYITYESTEGFREKGFAPDGSVKGFGWKNIGVFAAGAQFLPTSRTALRIGYNHSGNPIPDDLSMFNVPAPAIVTDHLTLGGGFRLSPDVAINFGYYHAFTKSLTGPLQRPNGPLPGTSVTNELSEDSFLVQFSLTRAGNSR